MLIIETLKRVLAWIGVLLGIMSAISAVVHLKSLGLDGVFLELVATYRKVMAPVYDLAKIIPFPYSVSQLAVDLFSLYMVLFSMSLRSHLWPLSDPRVFLDQRRRDARLRCKIVDEEPKLVSSLPEEFYYGQGRTDGTWELWYREFRSVYYTYTKAFLLSLLTWPALSFLPLRRVRMWRYVFRRDFRETSIGIEFGKQASRNRAMVAAGEWHLAKRYLNLSLELVSIPLAVIIFLVLRTYAPL